MSALPRGMRVFPTSPSGQARSFADAPILIDGMEVLFTQKVALYPIKLEPAPHDAGRRPKGRDVRT